MLPSTWKPVSAGNLVRLGRPNDGGYVVSQRAVEASSLVLGMGLNDDWSFEEEFIASSGARAVCFDHSVDRGFWRWHAFNHVRAGKFEEATKFFAYKRFFDGQRAEHRRLKIGYDRPGEISLASILAEMEDSAVFLKVDIEGGEYRIFDDIIASQDRITGIAMELHDIDLHRDRITDFLGSLSRFEVTAFHPNNYGGDDKYGDPIVVEITLTRREFIDEPDGTTASDLAMPCNREAPELLATFEGTQG